MANLHRTYQIPHIVITSLQLEDQSDQVHENKNTSQNLTVIGSTARSDWNPRLFRIDIANLPCFFSGTGDMFAALMVVRLREQASSESGAKEAECIGGMSRSESQDSANPKNSWQRLQPQDDVPSEHLPLAKATERVLASMQTILEKTLVARDAQLARVSAQQDDGPPAIPTDLDGGEEVKQGRSQQLQRQQHERRLLETKAAEVRVVRNMEDLWDYPKDKYRAVPVEFG